MDSPDDVPVVSVIGGYGGGQSLRLQMIVPVKRTAVAVRPIGPSPVATGYDLSVTFPEILVRHHSVLRAVYQQVSGTSAGRCGHVAAPVGGSNSDSGLDLAVLVHHVVNLDATRGVAVHVDSLRIDRPLGQSVVDEGIQMQMVRPLTVVLPGIRGGLVKGDTKRTAVGDLFIVAAVTITQH